MDHLPAVRLALAQQGRDLGVVVVEGLLQQEGRAFLRTQPLQHGQEGQRDLFGHLGRLLWRGRFVDLRGGRQPRSGVVLALRPCGAQAVDAQPGGGGDQPGFGVADAGPVGLLPAQPGVLDDILGVAAAAQQAIGQPEQAGAVGFEGVFGVHATKDGRGRSPVTPGRAVTLA